MLTVILLSTAIIFFISFVYVFFQKQLQNNYIQLINNDKQTLENENNDLINQNNNLKKENQQLEIKYSKLQGEFETIKSNQQKQEEFFKEQQDKQQKWIEQQQENQKNIFQNISNNALKEQTEIGKQKINELLKPFQEKLSECKTAMDEVNLKTKTEIKNEISKMIQGAETLGKNAEDLAKAFRGKNKIQGNWGENQLENLLKNSGFEGLYDKQYNFSYKGKTYIPDFIIKLPDEKRFIIDSKVSMENYIKYYNSTDDNEKEKQIKEHINSIKKHIDELKKYQEGYKEYIKTLPNENLETLDFIVMFISPENAYVEAVLHSKQEILQYAYDNKVAIVTASSLMPILRMISHLWNIEKSNKNINNIVDKVVLLYDKLLKFFNKTNDTHEFLLKAVKAHEDATKYLAKGNDNVLKTAERIKSLMHNKITSNATLFVQNNQNDNDK